MVPLRTEAAMNDTDAVPIIVDRSVTKQGPERAGCVLVAGSHGGIFAGFLAAQARLRAVILNDAGVGRDDAGIAGLAYLQGIGMPAATVSCMSARIGDGADMLSRGIISHANERARALGVAVGQACAEAAEQLRHAHTDLAAVPPYTESRYALRENLGVPLVWGLDSASLVQPEDSDRILMIGSHGGLLGGDPASALRGAARAAVFNDAGVGIDGAGLTRLPALDARGMPAATVDCWSARIGDARSMWQTGTLSHVNAAARALGAAPGISACAFADLINGAR
jgi:hypothetical protein